MAQYSFSLKNKSIWYQFLNKFKQLDFYFTPEYHELYKFRYKNAKPLVWIYHKDKNFFIYSFNLTPIPKIQLNKKKIYDISSTYGFVGPISTTKDKKFLSDAWKEFDFWAKKKI